MDMKQSGSTSGSWFCIVIDILSCVAESNNLSFLINENLLSSLSETLCISIVHYTTLRTRGPNKTVFLFQFSVMFITV